MLYSTHDATGALVLVTHETRGFSVIRAFAGRDGPLLRLTDTSSAASLRDAVWD